MQRWIVALASWFFLVSALHAESRKFPYEAEVRADNVKLRSGPGKNRYATTELQKGSTLIVHRHDPGGWYMVSPPEGSFSWIAAEYVRSEAPGIGTVTLREGDTEGAPVWVGSDLSNDHSVRQRVLQQGDTVQILAEEIFQENTGSTRVYKIVPPAREFRWVKGDFVIPRNEELRQEALHNPYSNPLEAPTEEPAEEVEQQPLPLIAREPSASTTTSAAATASTDSNDPKAALREIDHHYTEMVELDPTQWDVEELARSYEGLATSAPQLAPQIKKRLTALEDRRKMHAEYRSFAQLSAETTQRDQLLVAQGNLSQPDMSVEIQLGNTAQWPTPVQVASTGPTLVAGPTLIDPQPTLVSSASVPSQPATATPKLNGAGIVQRLANGRFGIVAPEGRVLAVLQADRSIPLDRMVGQSMGVIGERNYDPRLGTDLLVVKRMLPIQLER